MRRIIVLEVTGGNVHFVMQPWKRIVEVYGSCIEFTGRLRIQAIYEIAEFLKEHPLLNTSDMQSELLRSIKVKTRDTGLTEYPETEAERKAIMEKLK